MFLRLIISFIFSVYLFSISCQAMTDGEEKEHNSLHPIFRAAFNNAIESHTNRLKGINLVFSRDSQALELSAEKLQEDSTFSLIVRKLIAMDDLNFENFQAQLENQEGFSPLQSLDEFYNLYYLYRDCQPLVQKLNDSRRPQLHLLTAQSINDLARTIFRAKKVTKQGNKVGFICDVHGVMTNEEIPFPSEKRTRRRGIRTLFNILSEDPTIKYVAASAYRDGSVVLKDLRETGLAKTFAVRKDDDYNFPSIDLVLDTERLGDITSGSLSLRTHGSVGAARWASQSSDMHYRSKGFTLALCHPKEIFSTVVIADDSLGNLQKALHSLLHSKTAAKLSNIYLVLVKPVANAEQDKLKSKTKKKLRIHN